MMYIILCGVDVIIFNAIERYVSCVMVVRVGPRSMAVDGCMLVPVCIVYLCFGYVCRNVCMMLCLYIGVLMCMHMSAYVCGVSICVCLYVCGGADVAWMMGLESWWCRAAGST